jgi:hypothetical protein
MFTPQACARRKHWRSRTNILHNAFLSLLCLLTFRIKYPQRYISFLPPPQRSRNKEKDHITQAYLVVISHYLDVISHSTGTGQQNLPSISKLPINGTDFREGRSEVPLLNAELVGSNVFEESEALGAYNWRELDASLSMPANHLSVQSC